MRIERIIPVVLVFFTVLTPARAEDTLSIGEAIHAALKSNHYIKSKDYGVKAAEWEALSSGSAFLPKLVFGEKYTTGDYNSYAVFTRINQNRLTMDNLSNAGTVSNFQSSLLLEMPVFSKKLFVNRDMKKTSLLTATEEFTRFQETISFQVFGACLSVLKTKSGKLLAERGLDEAREVLRVAKARVASGTGLRSDELRAQVFLKDKEAGLVSASNDHEIAKRALGLLLSEEKPVDVRGQELDRQLALPPLEDAVAQATANRRDYRADKHAAENADKGIELARSRFYPDLMLAAGYYNDSRSAPFGKGDDGYVAGLELRWELFDKTRHDDMKKANMESLKSREMLTQREKEIRFGVRESYMRADEAAKKLELARESVAAAEESYRLIGLRYENSLSTLVELLDAEVALTSARSGKVAAENDYYLSLGRALFEAGVFLTTISSAH